MREERERERGKQERELKGEKEREGKKESIIPTQIPRERDMESEIDRHTS
jgi:hypothetical protein